MNTSKYLIDVQLENTRDHVFIHGYTAAIDVVDEKIADFLSKHQTFEKSDLLCSDKTINVLEKRGYITEKTPDEEYTYVNRLAEVLFRKECILNRSFTFLVTYQCNFRCPYCFEEGLHDNNLAFTKEMVDMAYRAIDDITLVKELYPKKITLYGGEPLLKKNKDIIAYIISKGKERDLKFSAVTNGYDLDVYGDILSDESFTDLQITIDGVKERHNQRRIHCQGYPTFDKIIENIELALQKDINVNIRINTDKNNIEDLRELQILFDNLHFTDNPKFNVNSALLRNYSEETKSDYGYFTHKEFVQEHRKFQLKFGCQDYGSYQKIYNALKYQKPLFISSTFCGAQTNSFVLDPFGKIYPCWEVVNQPMHCIGNYAQEGKIVWNDQALKLWKKPQIINNPSCEHCKYALLCGGGCPAHNLTGFKCLHMEDLIHYAVNKAYQSNLIIV